MTLASAIAIAVVSCLLHEAAHAGCAAVLGSQVKRIGISRIGLYVVRSRIPGRWRETVAGLAGPALNLTLALLWLNNIPALHQAGWINAVLGVVNLLPLPHSDGLRVLALWRTAPSGGLP